MKAKYCGRLIRLWLALCRHDYMLFKNSLSRVEEVQSRTLLKILRRNRQSDYGKRCGFDQLGSAKDYQRAVPLTVYEDYAGDLRRVMAGESGILTTGPVRMLEPSSGSTAPSKLIPYTRELKRDFIRGINPWIVDLYTQCPGLAHGKAYWSITPPTGDREKTIGGIPIGFEEDAQYFGWMEKFILDRIFAVPGEVKELKDTPSFHYVTLLFLLKEESLTLISVWNPTFLILLLKPLKALQDSLLKDLAAGTITSPGRIEPALLRGLEKKLQKNPKRARELAQVLSLSSDGGTACYEQIWPQLKLISCWTDGNAEIFVPQIKALFPNTPIQGKGLLATEAFVSLPLYGEEGALLSIRSHFFEFEALNDEMEPTGAICLAQELNVGSLYTVVVTTGGGFYRYRLRDVVKVVGFTEACPRLKFIGKGENVSDLCGEKLSEAHVKSCVEGVLSQSGIRVLFYMMSPEIDDLGQGYVLFVELPASDPVTEIQLQQLAVAVETKLRENYHYNYCRELGQLRELRLFLIYRNATETYIRVCMERGQKEGNIKPCALHKQLGWTGMFRGAYMISPDENTRGREGLS